MKFILEDKMHELLKRTGGTKEFKHESGEISVVTLEEAGMGVKKLRVANLSPETSDMIIGAAMRTYGEVKAIHEEKWPRHYPIAISNGIRVVEIQLKKHVPSHLIIAGQRALVSYDRQPFTCYGCSEEGHLYSECPRRMTRMIRATSFGAVTWAEKVRNGQQGSQRTETANTMQIVREEAERTQDAWITLSAVKDKDKVSQQVPVQRESSVDTGEEQRGEGVAPTCMETETDDGGDAQIVVAVAKQDNIKDATGKWGEEEPDERDLEAVVGVTMVAAVMPQERRPGTDTQSKAGKSGVLGPAPLLDNPPRRLSTKDDNTDRLAIIRRFPEQDQLNNLRIPEKNNGSIRMTTYKYASGRGTNRPRRVKTQLSLVCLPAATVR
jgi:hypothetical protein